MLSNYFEEQHTLVDYIILLTNNTVTADYLVKKQDSLKYKNLLRSSLVGIPPNYRAYSNIRITTEVTFSQQEVYTNEKGQPLHFDL